VNAKPETIPAWPNFHEATARPASPPGRTHPAPLPGWDTETNASPNQQRPGKRNEKNRLVEDAMPRGPLALPVKSWLFDPSAAALDQNSQNDDNQHSGNNPNDHGSVHLNSSFFEQNA
jgi:hypothetical protein